MFRYTEHYSTKIIYAFEYPITCLRHCSIWQFQVYCILPWWQQCFTSCYCLWLSRLLFVKTEGDSVLKIPKKSGLKHKLRRGALKKIYAKNKENLLTIIVFLLSKSKTIWPFCNFELQKVLIPVRLLASKNIYHS